MKNDRFRLNRRTVLTALAGAALGPLAARPADAQGLAQGAAQTRSRLDLTWQAGTLDLRPGTPPTPVWSLNSGTPGFISRVRRGEALDIALSNTLPMPLALDIRGLDGAVQAEPLLGQPALAAGGKASLAIVPAQAGTFLIDPRLLDAPGARAIMPHVLIVEDDAPTIADRDAVLLIEDWRLRPDGTALTPGFDPGDATALFTINRLPTLDLTVARNERLRLRIVNACQRAIVALKIADYDVRVMAIDSAPAEPFLARGGQIVLAPGTRVDALIDATQAPGAISNILLHDGIKPRPIARIVTSSGPPIRAAPQPDPAPLVARTTPRIDLKGALRIDLALDPSSVPSQWQAAASFDKTAPPLLRAKRGRTVVLAITHAGRAPATFHLHGHHFRLLDRLDDGWKPFWLDTLMFNPGQTQRIAFAADFSGDWLMESVGNDWRSPRLLRWYAVE